MTKYTKYSLVILLGLVLGTPPAQGYQIPSSVIGAGGGLTSGGGFLVRMTLGQPLVGISSTAGHGLYAGWWARGGIAHSTPVLLALVSADAFPDRVRVAWETSTSTARVTPYRRTTNGPWSALAPLDADGTGRVVLEDHDVRPGARYGEVWVDVPVTAMLALARFAPNPVAGDLVISFSLPDAAPATVEVLDVTGRKVADDEVGGLGAGEHALRHAGLPPGLYLVRLVHAGRALTRRVCVLR